MSVCTFVLAHINPHKNWVQVKMPLNSNEFENHRNININYAIKFIYLNIK